MLHLVCASGLPGMCGEEGGQVGRGTSGPLPPPPLNATVCVCVSANVYVYVCTSECMQVCAHVHATSLHTEPVCVVQAFNTQTRLS